MRVFSSVVAVFLASSLVAASPVAFEKRADNVVVVTVTESITRTTHAAGKHKTRTVTVYAAMGDPMQRPANVQTTTLMVPTTPSTTAEVPTPAAPSTQATSDTPATPATTSVAVVANDVSAASTSTASSGLFSGQGTFYSTGLTPIPPLLTT